MKLIKKNKLLIILMIVFLVIALLLYGSGYHSIDFKTDQQIEEHVKKYMDDKYNIDSKLTLKRKELLKQCAIWIDTCLYYNRNKSVYIYRYKGTDENNNKFTVSYTNKYIYKYKVNEFDIDENYNTYKEVEDIKKIVSNYYDNFDVYHELVINDIDRIENDVIIRIYSDEKDINNIKNVNNKILYFNTKFIIVFTTNYNTYKEVLNESNFLNTEYPRELDRKMGQLGYIKKEDNLDNKDKSLSTVYQSLSSIDIDNYTIILGNNYGNTYYYIYQQVD